MPEEGLEPSRLATHDFESCVSAIPPLRRKAYNTPAMDKRKILVIVGPTSSGKSALAVRLAKRFGGEVISADSRQVYRGLDVGTGKVTKKEMAGIPHHLLDVASPRKAFTAHQYALRARKAAEDVARRSKLPILAGGTGFYADALLGRIPLSKVPPDPALRKRLEAKSADALFAILKKAAPRRARALSTQSERNNKARLIRAIEIARARRSHPAAEHAPILRAPDTVLWIGLALPMNRLEKKIRARLRERIRGGLVAEGRRLHRRGLSFRRMRSLGLEYGWLADLLEKKTDRAGFEEGLYRDIRRFAKRQIAYWKRNGDIEWFSPAEAGRIERRVQEWLRGGAGRPS